MIVRIALYVSARESGHAVALSRRPYGWEHCSVSTTTGEFWSRSFSGAREKFGAPPLVMVEAAHQISCTNQFRARCPVNRRLFLWQLCSPWICRWQQTSQSIASAPSRLSAAGRENGVVIGTGVASTLMQYSKKVERRCEWQGTMPIGVRLKLGGWGEATRGSCAESGNSGWTCQPQYERERRRGISGSRKKLGSRLRSRQLMIGGAVGRAGRRRLCSRAAATAKAPSRC